MYIPPPRCVLPATDKSEERSEQYGDDKHKKLSQHGYKSEKPSGQRGDKKHQRLSQHCDKSEKRSEQHGGDKHEKLSQHGDESERPSEQHIDDNGSDMASIPARPEPRVPTSKVLRLLLGLLKRSPAGVIKDVGVQLMLLAAGIEVAKACPPSSTSVGISRRSNSRAELEQPSTVDKPRRSNDRAQHLKKRKQRDKRGTLNSQAEATAVLTLARQAAERRAKSLAKPGGNNTQSETAAAVKRKKNMKRFCKLRTTVKVEDGLQDWAAKRGQNISAFAKLLGLFGEIKPEDAKLVLDRVVRIPAGDAAKVRIASSTSSLKL